MRSAVCQGSDATQAQQSTIGGHQRQAKHLGCRGQKAICRIRMLKRQLLCRNDDFMSQWCLAHVHRCPCHPVLDGTVQLYPTLGTQQQCFPGTHGRQPQLVLRVSQFMLHAPRESLRRGQTPKPNVGLWSSEIVNTCWADKTRGRPEDATMPRPVGDEVTIQFAKA